VCVASYNLIVHGMRACCYLTKARHAFCHILIDAQERYVVLRDIQQRLALVFAKWEAIQGSIRILCAQHRLCGRGIAMAVLQRSDR
jgi:hypothetical protein